MNELEMKARFEELAPWHVNGTLEASDREWVERYVRDHPQAAAELRWYESMQAKIRENAPVIAPDLGWDKLQRRIRQERRAKQTNWSQRINDFLASVFIMPRPALAYAAMALVVVQAGVIGALLVQQDRQAEEFEASRAMQPEAGQLGPVLRVSFKADAPERQIRMILVGIGGTLVGGPGQLGDYIVYVPAEKIEAARATLAVSPNVESADIIATVPATDE